ncbi:uncharacterized protein LOC123311741 [Coccinella septempunctata]|uniref:uncharacterized protein LOC123311741 n=1 Tax=Coccinella septempunctata TaxID=41139 RepID=UPI001D096D2C|nr:uncharacterized protein LOC123311741 [Coccinella septempunctata]
MITDYEGLPFFPKYETDFLYDDKLKVTWFESKFSQSFYNYQNSANGSNACTLICIILAARCNRSREKLPICGNKEVSPKLINIFAKSMLDGNHIHNTLKKKGMLKNINLTVPEALSFADKMACGLKEWKCMLYLEPLYTSLFQNLKTNWLDWIDGHSHDDLYVILITDSRSVLFYFHDESDNIVLFDSHQHSADKGACLAVVKRQRLKTLCKWFAETLSVCYKCNPRLYELSFLYFEHKIEKTM